MESFRIKGEYIELIKLLKAASLVESGGVAKLVVSEGLVKVDGEVETRLRRKLYPGSVVEFEGQSVKIEG